MKTTHKKRNIVFLTAVLAITLVLGFMWAGCSNPAGGPPAAVPVTYKGGSGSSATELTIDDKGVTGITYELKVGGVTVSKGTVKKVGNDYVFTSTADPTKKFTVPFSGGAPDFTGVSVPVDDGSSITLPSLEEVKASDNENLPEQSPAIGADQFAVDPAAYSGGEITFTKYYQAGNSILQSLSSLGGLGTVKLAADGTITLTLNQLNAESTGLNDLGNAYMNSGCTVSPPTAGVKGVNIYCFATDDGGKELRLVHKTESYNYINYFYATAAVTIMGTDSRSGFDERYNINLKEGWNMIVYKAVSQTTGTITTGNFNPDDYHWVVE
jgi:hypothetical protein